MVGRRILSALLQRSAKQIATTACFILMASFFAAPVSAGSYSIDCPAKKKLVPEPTQPYEDATATVTVTGCVCATTASKMYRVEEQFYRLGRQLLLGPLTKNYKDGSLQSVVDSGNWGDLKDLIDALAGKKAPFSFPGRMTFDIPPGSKKSAVLACFSKADVQRWLNDVNEKFQARLRKAGLKKQSDF